ncbi:DUF4158 domain-containing protein [Variovorax sp. J22P240]|nr:DUF4158 domain-containing protein [Variovorax sp. J22P240]MDM0002806.1 DUF4158 domain-containing protein [Variovorax sp. J22P240]
MRELPRDTSAFELQAFFTFGRAERELIRTRRGESLKLGLALHIGLLRMTRRVLDAFRIVPPALWRHLDNELGAGWDDMLRFVASVRAGLVSANVGFRLWGSAAKAVRGRWRDELVAISGSHALLTNIVIAWNTAHLQAVIDRW